MILIMHINIYAQKMIRIFLGVFFFFFGRARSCCWVFGGLFECPGLLAHMSRSTRLRCHFSREQKYKSSELVFTFAVA